MKINDFNSLVVVLQVVPDCLGHLAAGHRDLPAKLDARHAERGRGPLSGLENALFHRGFAFDVLGMASLEKLRFVNELVARVRAGQRVAHLLWIIHVRLQELLLLNQVLHKVLLGDGEWHIVLC